jgi:hypothetical protein
MTENPPTTDMFFGDEDNPTMWFAEFQRMLPLSWVENEKVSHFVNHIVPNSYASDWIDTLTRNDMASLAAIRTAFNVRWPPPERPKFSRAEQMERIREQILREENVRKWVTPSDRRKADYGQNIWANEVAKAAITMGDTAGFLIECAVDGIPNILKDHLSCRYETWEEFKKDIRGVTPHRIKRGKEKLEHERMRDAEIAQLRAQTAATAATLDTAITQLSHLHVSSAPHNRQNPTSYRNPHPIVTQFHNPNQQQPHSAPAQGNWLLKRPPLTKELVLERTAMIPQRPSSNEGRQQYKADVNEWHNTHGMNATPSITRPYPITPGTALPGTGECFDCGMVTDPRHTSGSCENKARLPPLETRWRQIVTGTLRRLAQPRVQPTPIQYVWSAPQSQPAYQQGQVPVLMVDTRKDETTENNTTYWGNTQDNEWDWQPENDQGLQQYASQP